MSADKLCRCPIVHLPNCSSGRFEALPALDARPSGSPVSCDCGAFHDQLLHQPNCSAFTRTIQPPTIAAWREVGEEMQRIIAHVDKNDLLPDWFEPRLTELLAVPASPPQGHAPTFTREDVIELATVLDWRGQHASFRDVSLEYQRAVTMLRYLASTVPALPASDKASQE